MFGNKAKTETELIVACHGGTEVNLVTALGFYSILSCFESLLNLEQKHEIVTAISEEVFRECYKLNGNILGNGEKQ